MRCSTNMSLSPTWHLNGPYGPGDKYVNKWINKIFRNNWSSGDFIRKLWMATGFLLFLFLIFWKRKHDFLIWQSAHIIPTYRSTDTLGLDSGGYRWISGRIKHDPGPRYTTNFKRIPVRTRRCFDVHAPGNALRIKVIFVISRRELSFILITSFILIADPEGRNFCSSTVSGIFIVYRTSPIINIWKY